ncbi:MAG TPA: M23 family metallopeptidase [Stellaceae bacterium]|nr:M23 family metallopeptidase [Stellaceae bacterium]
MSNLDIQALRVAARAQGDAIAQRGSPRALFATGFVLCALCAYAGQHFLAAPRQAAPAAAFDAASPSPPPATLVFHPVESPPILQPVAAQTAPEPVAKTPATAPVAVASAADAVSDLDQPTVVPAATPPVPPQAGIKFDQALRCIYALWPSGHGEMVLATTKRIVPRDPCGLASLQTALKTLPLALPLAAIEIDSGFGWRRDPFTGRAEFHSGIDLGGSFRAPVYGTAAGTVIFSGTKQAYGRTVEINHGNGIVTRYAHLSRLAVIAGQHVGTHQIIGELGSTGRSTGPHLHYEVLVASHPVDPSGFLAAGQMAPQTASR